MADNSQPLLQVKPSTLITYSDVEGSCRIVAIEPLRISKSRVTLGIILSILSGLMFALACRWSIKFTKRFFFVVCQLEDATHFWITNEDKTYNISKRTEFDNHISFVNRKIRYLYNEHQDVFKALEFSLDSQTNAFILQLSQGVEDVDQRRAIYGTCQIDIPLPNVFTYLLKELTAPFYILQYISCVLWVFEGYPELAVIMIAVSISITTLNFILLISSVKKLRDLARHKNNVKVIRQPNAAPVAIDSEALVPGDVLVVEAKMTVPCDCVILTGELMMNEASLTGESVPIAKEGLENNGNIFNFANQKKNCLFEGTKVLLTKPTEQHYVLALVIRTGFCSFKGQIFRSVLYPKPLKFTFYRQAIKFLFGLGVVVLVLFFIELYKLVNLQFKPIIIFSTFGNALTYIIPPALPIFISMCMTFSLVRLRSDHEIFGVDPQRTLVAGSVDTICFDKTGTLTTSVIEVFGYQLAVTQDNKGYLQNVTLASVAFQKDTLIFKLFGSCHGVAKIDGELMGDSLDIEMLNFSGYSISDHCGKDSKQHLKGASDLDIIRNYEFESGLQRMSVIVRDNRSHKYYIFAKGSPEKIIDFSLKDTVPHNYKHQLDTLAIKGHRVLGLGYREVSEQDVTELLKQDRSSVEHDLQFLGLLILENKLKADTAHVIRELNAAGLDLKIISGDNGLTTVQCARECNIFEADLTVLMVDYNKENKELIIEKVDQESVHNLGDEHIQLNFNKSEHKQDEMDQLDTLLQHLKESNSLQDRCTKVPSISDETHNAFEDFGFAITGNALDYFTAPSEAQDGVVFHNDRMNSIRRLIIEKSRVFARMRPEQKSQIIEFLQQYGRTVLMIGDGANDCVEYHFNSKAAIKQANVGVSFAQCDASYAAPFSSSGQSIDCVKFLLLDGRATLCNAMEVFQYYVLVSVMKYIGAMLIAIQGGNFSTWQWLALNYLASLPFVGAICLSKPCKELSNRLPTDDMTRMSNQVLIYFHFAMTSVGLICNYIYWAFQSWRTRVDVAPDGHYILEGQIQTTMFLCLLVYFQSAMISVYMSKPFKGPIYTHVVMMGLMVLMTVVNILFFFTYYNWMQWGFQIEDLQPHGQFMDMEFLICMAISIIMITSQEFYIKLVLPCSQPIYEKKKIVKEEQ